METPRHCPPVPAWRVASRAKQYPTGDPRAAPTVFAKVDSHSTEDLHDLAFAPDEGDHSRYTLTLMSTRFDVRPATLADAVAISVLVNSAYRGESSRVGWTTEADYLDGQRTDPATLAEAIANSEKQRILCFRDRDELTAVVYLEKINVDAGVGCYLGMLTVNPKQQNGGIGRTVIEAAEDYAREWGAKQMVLGVLHLREELMSWYERRGYKRNGEHIPFPYEDEKAGLPKLDGMYFVMFDKSL